jgi:bile acid:Na+ symporter, BASS family
MLMVLACRRLSGSVIHQGTVTGNETTIQILTCSALVGLLGAVGLRLTWGEVKAALVRCRLAAILLVNFIVIPALAVGAATGLGLKRDIAVAMVLLAASPFAPVVPVFARMARADLALAAGLTAVFPLASVLLTPLAAQAAMWVLADTDRLRFNMLASLAMLAATITLPLAAGVLVRHRLPNFGRRLLRPVEVISEATGAASLAFVTVTGFSLIVDLGWRAWLAMAAICELSLLLGWKLGGPTRGARQVVALGTGNRNIALALLVAIQSFPGTPVVPAVAGNGLLLIGLGLLHVGWWRFAGARRSAV